jgi:hypothetical protein
MIQVHITPTNPEYAKYLTFDNRFICKKIKYQDGKMTFYELWGTAGWQKTLTVEDNYFEVEIKRVRE